MISHTPHCPHCSKVMQPGYELDHTHGGVVQSQWVAGSPDRSFWTGLKLHKKPRIPVVSFRCPRCGMLQSYALDG